MKMLAPFVLLLSGLVSTAQADLALTGYSAAGPLSTQERIWIREGQVRRDFVDRGRAYTHLFDLGKRQVALIDHVARLVELHDLKSLQAGTEIGAPTSALKLSLDPTGETRPLRHWNCEAHTLAASMPTRLGPEETVFHLNGKVWVARGTPEQAAVKKLIDMTRQKDFFLGIPAAVKATPAQAKMLSELVRELAPRGLPCGGELDARYEGTGPMANLARRLPARLSLSIQDFSNTPIKPELFELPEGYQVRR
ncbi:MAG: hypothetical protein AB1593_08770 [Pseudomonadota bacterium]